MKRLAIISFLSSAVLMYSLLSVRHNHIEAVEYVQEQETQEVQKSKIKPEEEIISESGVRYTEASQNFMIENDLHANYADTVYIYTLCWDETRLESGKDMFEYIKQCDNLVRFDSCYTDDSLVAKFDISHEDLDGYEANKVGVGFFDIETGNAYAVSGVESGTQLGYEYSVSEESTESGYKYTIELTGDLLNELAFFVYGDDMYMSTAEERIGVGNTNIGYREDVREFSDGILIEVSYFVQSVG